MKILAKVSALAVILFMGFMLLDLGGEWVWAIKRKRVSSRIKASYLQSALRGEVPAPATNSDALRCWSLCYWSLPDAVGVRVSSGARFFFIARDTTNTDRPYSFRFITGTDANGKQITNTPGI
ncbi:exported hypothetical protein [Verrucomicrobia bacterium]|nr:exported hypothetical protein [Verrucomicrobiota bacterium]